MKKLVLLSFMLFAIVQMQAQRKHTVGEKFGGGIVIDVTPDGLHGLIAETQDQGTCNWDEAPALIVNPANHSTAGKAFTDWRLPNKGYDVNTKLGKETLQ